MTIQADVAPYRRSGAGGVRHLLGGAAWHRAGPPAAAAAVCVLLWEVAVRSGVVDSADVPAFSAVCVRLVQLLEHGATWNAIGHTLTGWGAGLAISAVVGSLCGLLIGASRFATKSTSILIDALRSVPAPALIFTLVLLLGTGYAMTITVVTCAAVWPILVQALYGSRALDPVLVDLASTYQVSRVDQLLRLRLPTALPYIATGIRLSTSICLVVQVTAEFLGGAAGLGLLVDNSRLTGDIPAMYALILVSGVLGVLLNALIAGLESRVLRWHPSHRRSQ